MGGCCSKDPEEGEDGFSTIDRKNRRKRRGKKSKDREGDKEKSERKHRGSREDGEKKGSKEKRHHSKKDRDESDDEDDGFAAEKESNTKPGTKNPLGSQQGHTRRGAADLSDSVRNQPEPAARQVAEKPPPPLSDLLPNLRAAMEQLPAQPHQLPPSTSPAGAGAGAAPAGATSGDHLGAPQPQNQGPSGQQRQSPQPPAPQQPKQYYAPINSNSSASASSRESITSMDEAFASNVHPEYRLMEVPKAGECPALALLIGFAAEEELRFWAAMPPFPPSLSKKNHIIVNWTEECGMDVPPVPAIMSDGKGQVVNPKLLKMNEKMLKTIEARSTKKRRKPMRMEESEDGSRRGSVASISSARSDRSANSDAMSELLELEAGRVAAERAKKSSSTGADSSLDDYLRRSSQKGALSPNPQT